ncbi:tol-pal system protein YbgF [Maritimibacter sp. DP1N21-5]|uniref:tol-pal system protein YbgF n=1 Tax=Maritimibacter sp. DP1N21-5 TaxID=2836867 RepID=UPI001C47123A|nr:tol-pal system protein YbgF [Maritimibacter sp. DP1N21-5]MBV7410231.1 tol-pal system protein YbgF [Maritimibacter sp. DP1N21-5]
MLKSIVFGAALAACVSGIVSAQDSAQTLADVRQELTVLNVELQKLKTELNTTGAPAINVAGSTLDRVNAIEAAMTRLTAKTEELEFRINSVANDGANRVGDLSFRLCELEPDCDIMNEGMSKPLGGEVAGGTPSGTMTTPVVVPSDPGASADAGTTGGAELAIGEKADFDAAVADMDAGNFPGASEKFARLVETYPGTPLTGQAHYLRGEALAAQGMTAEAARAYLASFSAAPAGENAGDALVKLGASLGQLGQVNEACATLGEVPNRFPGSQAANQAQIERQTLGCF